MSRHDRLAFPATLSVIAAVLVWNALGIKVSRFDPVGGQLFPLFATSLLLLLCLCMLVIETIKARRDAGPLSVRPAASDVVRVALLLSLVGGAIGLVACKLLPLLAAVGAVIVLGALLLSPGFDRRQLIRQAGAIALATGVTIGGGYLLFEQVLHIRLP